jgi:hypothetical protein
MAEARQERPEHENRRAHRLHELVGRDGVIDGRRVERKLLRCALLAHAHLREQLERRTDVL